MRLDEEVIMKNLILITSLCLPVFTFANDSTGYVGTGGIQYLKNKNIAMQSEDLFISKKIIKVDYQFKNLSNQDITETILFPLPPLDNFFEGGDFANSEALINSFKVQVNGKALRPERHIRVFTRKTEEQPNVDVTEEFKACGFSEKEMLNPWTRSSYEYLDFEKKLRNCSNKRLKQVLPTKPDDIIWWSSQVVYSWKQVFKANSVTQVKHQYQPLVGGSVSLYEDRYFDQFCMDSHFKKGLKKSQTEHSPYQVLSYILSTGANWAKPIQDFKLTIERDKGELVSFCWNGKVNKISPTQFQMVEKNFVPKQDLDVIFVY